MSGPHDELRSIYAVLFALQLNRWLCLLAGGGLVFVVCYLQHLPDGVTVQTYRTATSAFWLSLLCGVIFLMRAAGLAYRKDGIDIYEPVLRWTCLFQLFFLGIGIGTLL
jgi:hypothetical protein